MTNHISIPVEAANNGIIVHAPSLGLGLHPERWVFNDRRDAEKHMFKMFKEQREDILNTIFPPKKETSK